VQLLLGNLEARVVKERDPHLNLWVRLGMMRFNKALVTDANLTPIAKQLKNADPAVQTTAAQILGTIGPDAKGKVPDLLEVLKSQDLIAVGTTIWALGNIGPAASKAVPQIEPFLTHMDESIKKAARTSIDAIQKKPMTPTVP
jgi:HEAT repeat protein